MIGTTSMRNWETMSLKQGHIATIASCHSFNAYLPILVDERTFLARLDLPIFQRKKEIFS